MKNFTLLAALAAAMLFTPSLAVAHGDGEGSVVVRTVNTGSPAATAGLEVGDILLRFDDREIKTQRDLERALASYQPGDRTLLTVVRDGETLVLPLVFGERSGGGVSVGVSLAITSMEGGGPDLAPGEGLTRDQCLTWVNKTYRVDSMIADLGLDLQSDAETLRTCIEGNVLGMPSPMPVRYCDNAFKVHCSGIGLLTEIGEAQVERCEEWLGEKLSSCAAQVVFDRYSRDGKGSDKAACRAARSACSDAQS